MLDVHIANGILRPGRQPLAGIWGGTAWLRREPSVGFWYALRVAQVRVVLQVGARLDPAALRPRWPSGLHYLYGVLPLIVSLLAEGARAGVAERELEGLDFDSLPRERRRAIAPRSSAARPGSWPSRRWSSLPSRFAHSARAGTDRP